MGGCSVKSGDVSKLADRRCDDILLLLLSDDLAGYIGLVVVVVAACDVLFALLRILVWASLRRLRPDGHFLRWMS